MPICAGVDSMPIMLRLIQIRLFCRPPGLARVLRAAACLTASRGAAGGDSAVVSQAQAPQLEQQISGCWPRTACLGLTTSLCWN